MYNGKLSYIGGWGVENYVRGAYDNKSNVYGDNWSINNSQCTAYKYLGKCK